MTSNVPSTNITPPNNEEVPPPPYYSTGFEVCECGKELKKITNRHRKTKYHIENTKFNNENSEEEVKVDVEQTNTPPPRTSNHREKTGNEKRKESCKKVGAEKKNKGHKREKDFQRKYNPQESNNPTEYGPTSDTSICSTHPICNKLFRSIKPSNLNVSNKSGNNIQLILGNIPELKDIDSEKLNKDKEYVRNICNKYLKKTASQKPAGILVYKDTKNKEYIFFNTDDIVEYIVNKCKWRKLKSGRLKGDFDDDSKKGYRQYITYEYRSTHKSYFLGFNGNKGIQFINLLKHPIHGIKYVEDNY